MAYVITAKTLGTPDKDATTNYYTSAQGLINTSYTDITLVFSWKGAELYGGVSGGYMVIDSPNLSNAFVMGYTGGTGGWDFRTSSGNFWRTNDNLPGPLTLDIWHSCMFVINAAGHGEFWVDGVQVNTWEKGPNTFNAMDNATMGIQWDGTFAQPGCISHVWCDNTYLDPATNWDKFFDTNNRPIYLGDTGQFPTGSTPLSYFPNGDPTDNQGTLDNWIEVGTVPTCATSPTDGNDPDPPIPGYPKDCDFKLYHALDTQLRQQIVAHLNTLCGRINEIVTPGLADLTLRVDTLEERVDNIVAFLQLEQNLLGFDINGGVDYPLPAVTDDPVPLTSVGSVGLNPPTISGSTITINSPGRYQLVGYFGMDTGSADNVVTVEPRHNSVKGGVAAGVRQAGGQGAIAVQSTAEHIIQCAVGDTFDFVATSTDPGAELVAAISGGSCAQIDFDWDALNP